MGEPPMLAHWWLPSNPHGLCHCPRDMVWASMSYCQPRVECCVWAFLEPGVLACGTQVQAVLQGCGSGCAAGGGGAGVITDWQDHCPSPTIRWSGLRLLRVM